MIRVRWLVPYLLLAPGLIWLFLFFVLPNIQMFVMSLSSRAGGTGLRRQYAFTWEWENYTNAFANFSDPVREFDRLRWPGDTALPADRIPARLRDRLPRRALQEHPAVPGDRAVLHELPHPDDLVADHPRQRRRLPLGRQGWPRPRPSNFNVLGTPLAVVAGLTYQFLPFMVLPSTSRSKRSIGRLVEAARDLYAGPWRAAARWSVGSVAACLAVAVLAARAIGVRRGPPDWLVATAYRQPSLGGGSARPRREHPHLRGVRPCSFPLSLSGVFAGSILTFIPAPGDYVNADLLGNHEDADDRQRHPEPIPCAE